MCGSSLFWSKSKPGDLSSKRHDGTIEIQACRLQTIAVFKASGKLQSSSNDKKEGTESTWVVVAVVVRIVGLIKLS